MKDYKQKIYSSYYTSHTKQLYGEPSLEKIKKQFPVYEYYFGKHLPDDKNISIIDLGCGRGEFVYWLISNGYKNTIGIDVSTELIDIGKNLGIDNIFCDDILNYFHSNKVKFDVIILRDVLEHFEKAETYEMVKLLYENLRDNGIIVLQVPNGQSPFGGKIIYGDFTHHQAFTVSSIHQLFKSIGYSQINIFDVTPVPKNVIGIMRLGMWKILRTFLKITQLIGTGDGSGYFSQNLIAVITK